MVAAVLACGEGAILSHHSAAALWELLKPIDGPIHVSVPTLNGRKAQRGIHLHRCPSLSTPREPSPSPSYLPAGGRGRRPARALGTGVSGGLVAGEGVDVDVIDLPVAAAADRGDPDLDRAWDHGADDGGEAEHR